MFLKCIACLVLFTAISSELFAFVNGINVTFKPSRIKHLFVDAEQNVSASLHSERQWNIADDVIALRAEPASVLSASFLPGSWNCENSVCNRTIQITGRFLGFGKVFILQNVSKSRSGSLEARSEWEELAPPLEVTVLRQDKLINKLFIIFVATVVTINYVNFGCALELDVVKEVLRRPIGPAVGFGCQFVIMPLISYAVGYWLFTDPVLRLGLFTFGCSPGGGASNMWTVLLGGNLNLSITMTFISNIAAFGTLPLWLFTLGRTILRGTNIVIPYANIMYSLVSLVIPLAIGLLVQRFFPKAAARSKRFLAPVCIVLLIAIIVLAAVANTYIFFMLSWRMVFAASLSVWSGFLAGVIASWAFRFSTPDVVAVAVETGVQNSGIAFVLLSYSLEQPVSDMAAVVPVAGSMITPIPLFLVLCIRKCWNCCTRRDGVELQGLRGKKEEYQSTKGALEEPDSELKEVKAE